MRHQENYTRFQDIIGERISLPSESQEEVELVSGEENQENYTRFQDIIGERIGL